MQETKPYSILKRAVIAAYEYGSINGLTQTTFAPSRLSRLIRRQMSN